MTMTMTEVVAISQAVQAAMMARSCSAAAGSSVHGHPTEVTFSTGAAVPGAERASSGSG